MYLFVRFNSKNNGTKRGNAPSMTGFFEKERILLPPPPERVAP